MTKKRRFRRRRSSQVFPFNERNYKAEPGDLMVDHYGRLFRLEESSGWGARKAGMLYTRLIKPPVEGWLAKIIDGEVWWTGNQ